MPPRRRERHSNGNPHRSFQPPPAGGHHHRWREPGDHGGRPESAPVALRGSMPTVQQKDLGLAALRTAPLPSELRVPPLPSGTRGHLLRRLVPRPSLLSRPTGRERLHEESPRPPVANRPPPAGPATRQVITSARSAPSPRRFYFSRAATSESDDRLTTKKAAIIDKSGLSYYPCRGSHSPRRAPCA